MAPSPSVAAPAVRPALRRLVAAMHTAFKNDEALLTAARATIREHLANNAEAPPDKIPAMIDELETATTFLRTNIVQAPLNERGNYAVDAAAIDESKPRQ